MIVYLVQYAYYDGEVIFGIFSSREKAEEIRLQAIKTNDPELVNVEEFELDQPTKWLN